jgi:hypothetical protein
MKTLVIHAWLHAWIHSHAYCIHTWLNHVHTCMCAGIHTKLHTDNRIQTDRQILKLVIDKFGIYFVLFISKFCLVLLCISLLWVNRDIISGAKLVRKLSTELGSFIFLHIQTFYIINIMIFTETYLAVTHLFKWHFIMPHPDCVICTWHPMLYLFLSELSDIYGVQVTGVHTVTPMSFQNTNCKCFNLTLLSYKHRLFPQILYFCIIDDQIFTTVWI